MNQIHRDDPRVISHSGEWFPFRYALALFSDFLYFAGTVSRTLHQRGRKIRNQITNNPVWCIMVLHLIPRMVLESPPGRDREHRGISPHRIEESGRTAIGQRKFESDFPNHMHILILLVEKRIGGERAIPPRPKEWDLLAQFR